MVDLNKLLEIPKVIEVCEVVGEWKFVIEGCPVTLKIKVVRYPSGKYMGIANYKIQGPNQASPYICLRLRDSVEEAIIDSLTGFLDFWDPAQADKIKLIPNKNY